MRAGKTGCCFKSMGKMFKWLVFLTKLCTEIKIKVLTFQFIFCDSNGPSSVHCNHCERRTKQIDIG